MAVELMDEMVPGQGFKYVIYFSWQLKWYSTLFRDEDQQKKQSKFPLNTSTKYKQVSSFSINSLFFFQAYSGFVFEADTFQPMVLRD